MNRLRYFQVFLFLFVCCLQLPAQVANSGQVTRAHVGAIYTPLQDPDGDGFITESGAAFTSGSTELQEFEVLPNSVSGWREMANVDETNSDVAPSCGNTDLVTDDNGGGYGYYNIVDPTPAQPTNGDAYLLVRFRLASFATGKYGYNILLDTDGQYGSEDPNAVCGNQGFEREIRYNKTNSPSSSTVNIYDVDGNDGSTAATAVCEPCITGEPIQLSRAASAGGCATTTPTFVTIPLRLTNLGMPSDIAVSQLYVTMATTASGNNTSLVGGGNTKDYGGINSSGSSCGCDTLTTACVIFDCQTNCINTQFVAALPVDLTYCNAEATLGDVRLRWATSSETDSRHFEVEHSRDGVRFSAIGRVASTGGPGVKTEYEYRHGDPAPGTHYYRLRQVDYDGAFTHGPVVTAFYGNAGPADFALVPTLLRHGALRLERHDDDWASRADVRILDAAGRMVYQRRELTGRNLQLDVGELRPGTYVVQLHSRGHFATARFVKQ